MEGPGSVSMPAGRRGGPRATRGRRWPRGEPPLMRARPSRPPQPAVRVVITVGRPAPGPTAVTGGHGWSGWSGVPTLWSAGPKSCGRGGAGRGETVRSGLQRPLIVARRRTHYRRKDTLAGSRALCDRREMGNSTAMRTAATELSQTA